MKHQTGIIQILIAVIGLSCGCTGEKLLDEPVPEGPVEVHFFSSAIPTRAEGVAAGTDKLTADAKVRIYAYRKKAGETKATATNNYTVTTAADGGTQSLSPAAPASGTASEMILPSGTFNFYAVSTNSAETAVPDFPTDKASDGVPTDEYTTIDAKNGIDYLYAAVPEQKIAFGTKKAEIPLTFRHAGTQVQLTIIFGDGAHAGSNDAAQNFNLARVTIQPTTELNAKMHLYNGEIRFGNLLSGSPGSADTADFKQMSVVTSGTVANGSTTPANQVATCHLLPLAKATSQKMGIKIEIGNLVVGGSGAQPLTRTYTGELDASAGWLAGTSNQYTLTLSGTEIKFSTVTVVPWTSGTGGEVGNITDTTPTGDSTTP